MGSDAFTIGLIYRNVYIYRLMMRVLYGRRYLAKYRDVAAAIPAGSTVVDLCCGDCTIAPFLLSKNCRYIGLDINPHFVSWGKKQGYDIRFWNGSTESIPQADVICMQSSLYQFIPQDTEMVRAMFEKAGQFVILSEPIQNITTDSFKLLSFLARKLTSVAGKEFSFRHTEESLKKILEFIPRKQLVTRSGTRDFLIVISKQSEGHDVKSCVSMLS